MIYRFFKSESQRDLEHTPHGHSFVIPPQRKRKTPPSKDTLRIGCIRGRFKLIMILLFCPFYAISEIREVRVIMTP